jgi:hypothetical protein
MWHTKNFVYKMGLAEAAQAAICVAEFQDR